MPFPLFVLFVLFVPFVPFVVRKFNSPVVGGDLETGPGFVLLLLDHPVV